MAKENLGICSNADCTRPLLARGLCDACYKKAKRQGLLPPLQRWVNPVSIQHPIYGVWSRMLRRCRNPEDKDYTDYGGRGITYDPAWQQFPAFYADMHETYITGLFLDRLNNDGNYSKDNCRWATPTESARNRRSTKLDERKVALIREMFRGKLPEESVITFNTRTASLFAIAPSTVSNITSNRQWKL